MLLCLLTWPRRFCVRRLGLFVVPDADLVAGWSEGRPRDVEPARARQQLVGIFPRLEEVNEALELLWVERPDVGSLADEVLRVSHTAHLTMHLLATEARSDDDRPHDEPGGFQQLMTAIGQIGHGLHRRDVPRVPAQIEELG